MSTNQISEKLCSEAGNKYFCEPVDDRENIIDLAHTQVESLGLNRIQYEKFDALVNNYSLEHPDYIIYFWNDSSGFDYWNIQQEENNYAQCSINIKNDGCDIETLYFDIIKTIDILNEKLSDIHIDLKYIY